MTKLNILPMGLFFHCFLSNLKLKQNIRGWLAGITILDIFMAYKYHTYVCLDKTEKI